MEVSFSTNKLQKLCNSESKLRGKFGPKCADLIAQRLSELAGVETLEDMRFLPRPRCHELTGDRKGQLAVDVVHPRRLIFVPDHNPVPSHADGGLDWSQVTRVKVVEIGDYH